MTTKIAVSLPDETVRHLRSLVSDGKAPSVSAAVAEAVARQQREDAVDALIREGLAASGGPATAEELSWAGGQLGLE